MARDFFEHKADMYEQDDNRVLNVENIANSIIERVSLDRSMHLMDFGSGTGLLLERISPFVRKITAIDISKSMNHQLAQKRQGLGCELDIVEIDLVSTDFSEKYDGIISSMTMHHVKDIGAMFVKFYNLLNDDGIIAIADLDSEDGSFHAEDTGVYHYGFDRDVIIAAAKHACFRDVEVVDASAVHKPYGKFPVFLLTAKR
ncbi:class I SAM-dependent DNA methyltransferase [Teredinibacter haidensis]|uniref:class I SAM-dependent DNA methyltransferase n=1 Tax=Teredinibacter haidensis TaxID=2731755 RepID=UPI000948AB6C|nr:class I SAM-dependent methyltransferase [Teredinibacter haidensis]